MRSAILILFVTFFPFCHGITVIFDTENRTSTIDSPECERAKAACENDTDCYHRLFYARTTCATDECKTQCKTAALRLYETKFGRRLLGTDLSCLATVGERLIECKLNEKAATLHCTVAKLLCQLDDECAPIYDDFETDCRTSFATTSATGDSNVSCTKKCAETINRIFAHQLGARMRNCTCWRDDDSLCRHMKENVFDTCPFGKLVDGDQPGTSSISSVIAGTNTVSTDDQMGSDQSIFTVDQYVGSASSTNRPPVVDVSRLSNAAVVKVSKVNESQFIYSTRIENNLRNAQGKMWYSNACLLVILALIAFFI